MSSGSSGRRIGTRIVAVPVPSGSRRRARPIACTISITDCFGRVNTTQSIAGTSTPSVRHRTFDTTVHPSSGGVTSMSRRCSRSVVVKPPWTKAVVRGRSGRVCGGSADRVTRMLRAKSAASLSRLQKVSTRRSPNWRAALASTVWTMAVCRSVVEPPVVVEIAVVDGLAGRVLVEDRAEDLFVVHADQLLGERFAALAAVAVAMDGLLADDLGGGGGVQASLGRQPRVKVHQRGVLVDLPGAAVRLVDNQEIGD